ncbi:MAG TPA: LapA family protein [Acidimicrobiales bacterium]|nr:LapA family protein [Acidimicrobiales bacterium]
MAYQPGRSDVPLDDSGEGLDTRLVVRIVIGAIIVILTILFMVQNNEQVETSFIFFTVETRLWVDLLVAVLLGAVLGQLAEAMWNRRRKRRGGD